MTNLRIRQQQRENAYKLIANSKIQRKPTIPIINNDNGEQEMERRRRQIWKGSLKVTE